MKYLIEMIDIIVVSKNSVEQETITSRFKGLFRSNHACVRTFMQIVLVLKI